MRVNLMYGGLMNDAPGLVTGQRIGAIGENVRTFIVLYYHILNLFAIKILWPIILF